MEATTDYRSVPISPRVAENIDRVILAVRTCLLMDVAFVSEFTGTDRVLRHVDTHAVPGAIQAGSVIPMAHGYCQHIVSGRLPELIADTREFPFALTIPETKSLPIGAHLSVPIRLDDGRIYGTFCCFSHAPQPLLHGGHLGLMRTFAAMIANELAADLEVDAARQAKRERLSKAVIAGDPDMVFQPIVRLADLSLAGVEALSRFACEPKQNPDDWFKEAHAIGMGADFELLAARKALRACATLPAPLSVSINLSPATILRENLTDALAVFDPKRMIIEITEHEPVPDYAPMVAVLAELRGIGMRIAIDDAGAGYSSLRHVLSLRPDIIKLDVSLTRDLDHDPMREAMVAAMAEFARRTGTQIVAEGVETVAEHECLLKLGIAKAQGYRFGRPDTLANALAGAASLQLRSILPTASCSPPHTLKAVND